MHYTHKESETHGTLANESLNDRWPNVVVVITSFARRRRISVAVQKYRKYRPKSTVGDAQRFTTEGISLDTKNCSMRKVLRATASCLSSDHTSRRGKSQTPFHRNVEVNIRMARLNAR